MEHTVSLKLNHVFRRLYGRGKSAVNPCLAVYCRKNNLGYSRLGLTVGVKLGKAVVRNRTRRRIKEAYRIHEGAFFPGTNRGGPGCGPPTAVTELERSPCLWRTSSACSGSMGA
ncbi:MAG: ribonuclease P protein component [Flavonifractor plautii]